MPGSLCVDPMAMISCHYQHCELALHHGPITRPVIQIQDWNKILTAGYGYERICMWFVSFCSYHDLLAEYVVSLFWWWSHCNIMVILRHSEGPVNRHRSRKYFRSRHPAPTGTLLGPRQIDNKEKCILMHPTMQVKKRAVTVITMVAPPMWNAYKSL